MREISRTGLGAVESGRVVGRVSTVGQYLVVLAAHALRSRRSSAASTFAGAGKTLSSCDTHVVVARTFGGALLFLYIADTLLTNVLVESVTVAAFAERMARPANGLSCHGLQFSLDLRCHVFVEGSVRTNLFVLKTSNDFELQVDDGFIARVATVRTDIVLRSEAAADAVRVTRHALAQRPVVVLSVGTFFDAKRSVLRVLALLAVVGTIPGARAVAFFVALHALTVTGAVQPEDRVATSDAFVSDLKSLAGETKFVSRAPTAFGGTLVVTHVAFLVAALRGFVVLEHRVVIGRLH